MPKKDTASAVLGMLSAVGAQTRVTTAPEPTAVAAEAATVEPPEPAATVAEPVDIEPAALVEHTASISTLSPAAAPAKTQDDKAPRTIRLRAETARELRAAWLEAKRDDVLLQSQDFASTLVEEALSRRRRSRAASSR
jgi:hypothetical protein